MSGDRTSLRPLAGADHRPAYLNCPRCGLSIRLGSSFRTFRDCPRCLARAGTAVRLFGSGLPAHLLYATGSNPTAAKESDLSP